MCKEMNGPSKRNRRAGRKEGTSSCSLKLEKEPAQN